MSDSGTCKVKVLVFDQYSHQVFGFWHGEPTWQLAFEGPKDRCADVATALRRVYVNVKVVRILEEEID